MFKHFPINPRSRKFTSDPDDDQHQKSKKNSISNVLYFKCITQCLKQWWASQSADGLGFFNAITGGSFLNMSVFALNITPYITSSIIIQLLTIAID